MNQLLKAFFTPCIKLYWRGYFGKSTANWHPDSLEDRKILQQFLAEAGFRGQMVHVKAEQLEAVLAVAGKYGYSLETIDKFPVQNKQRRPSIGVAE